MNKISIFLSTIFCAFILYGNINVANAASNCIYNPYIYTDETSQNNTASVTICPAGQYVYSCDNAIVGYNWLKDTRLSVVEDPETGEQNWDEDIYNHLNNNLTNDEKIAVMRLFFNGQDTSAYDTNLLYALDDRDKILECLCKPLSENPPIVCKPCPDGGSVPASIVKTNNNTSLVKHSWEFHTIADCYMSEFEDSTGKFIYIDTETTSPTSATGAQCYYNGNTSEFAGDGPEAF